MELPTKKWPISTRLLLMRTRLDGLAYSTSFSQLEHGNMRTVILRQKLEWQCCFYNDYGSIFAIAMDLSVYLTVALESYSSSKLDPLLLISNITLIKQKN